MRGTGSIVFVAGAGVAGLGAGNTELLAATPSGGVRDLTSTSAASEYDASWSPDGSRVLFFSRSPQRQGKGAAEEPPGLYVWTPGGDTPKRIASCSYYCRRYDFQWSPDNRQIAFLSEAGKEAIKVMNADGSDVHTICGVERCGQGLDDPAWSPDGRRLVFDTKDIGPGVDGYNPPRAIWIANADGSGVRQLTQPNCSMATLGPHSRVCAIDTGPAWSPNGRLIAFARTSALLASFPQATVHAPLPGIEVMRADGSHLHSISTCIRRTDFGCYVRLPIAWAPDSKAIAYTPVVSDHASSFRITTLAGKTTTIRTCVVAGSGCLSPSELTWSPNGRRLAFVTRFGTSPSVWVIGRDGDGLHRVSRGGLCCLAWVRNPSLSG
jgi:Tol biopolymer transport system component